MSSNYSEAESSPKTSELKVYRFVMFCVPILFTFMLLFMFYLFYLRPRRVNWSSLRMRTTASSSSPSSLNQPHLFTEVESGLRKEVRELLPIIVYKESFSVRDTQCSVCLGDYEAEERLQQIPACGHTFHVNCIDHWLASHTTCPLCRLSLLPSAKSPSPRLRPPHLLTQPSLPPPPPPPTVSENSAGGEASLQPTSQPSPQVADSTAALGSAAENAEREPIECKERQGVQA